MATVGAPPLKVTMKADPSSLEGSAAKRPRASAPWFDEGWVRQFKDLAPNPVPVDRTTLLELRGAAPPAAPPVALAEATARALKPVHTQDDHLDETERTFRDDLASFLKFRSRHELYSPIFLGVPLPMRKVFKKVRAMGGYRAVCDSKLWMRVCREAAGGKDLSGQTSASFAMRRNYEKTGMLEWEQALDGTSLGGGAVAIDPDAGKVFVPVAAEEIVPTGTRVRVLWNEENGESAWYGASVRGYDASVKKHHVAYDDDTEETIDFGEEKVERVAE
jgi:hypothetical protein